MPRPTRTLRMREPVGGCKFASVKERCSFDAGLAGLCRPRLRGRLAVFFAMPLLHHFHEVTHLVNHAAHRRRVLALHHLMQSSQTETANGLAHVVGAANEADYPLDLHVAGAFSGGFLLRGHALLSPTAAFSLAGLPLISSTVFERVSATCAASFKPSKAANVALTTLCGLDVPMDFVSTLVIPATCITFLTGPPATTTSAEKLRFLPPLTTLVTRLMAITSSFKSERFTSRSRRTARLSRKICFDIGLEL